VSVPRPYYLSTHRKPRSSNVTVIEQVGRETLAAIILAACAVARADGTADRSERQALVAFLRERGILARHGRAAVLASYDAAVKGRQRSLAETADELAALDRLAGTSGALLIAAAAQQVALADGVAWPQEAALLGIISDRLGLRAAQARS
jgi:tellurite resistance protein